MTYQELQEKNKALDRQIESICRQQAKNEKRYIEEHEPFPFRRYQRVMVTLRVTEENRKHLTEKEKAKRRYQKGYEYSVVGCLNGYIIDKDGTLRPTFFGGTYYGRFDEIVSITPTEQIEGHCSKCRRYKDGLCYRNGGMDLSKKCADHKVEEDDFTCPKYEELTELWSYDGEKHYPNVTIVKHEKPVKYRIYAINWGTYSEWDEKEIKTMYRFKP